MSKPIDLVIFIVLLLAGMLAHAAPPAPWEMGNAAADASPRSPSSSEEEQFVRGLEEHEPVILEEHVHQKSADKHKKGKGPASEKQVEADDYEIIEN